jgi:glycosyltransferase involved in cell wall biosynthesis
VSLRNSSVPKRVAVFVEHFPPYLGSDRSVFELAKRVAEKGVKVRFIVTQPLRYLIGQRPSDWSYKENWSNPPKIVHENISAKYLLVGRRTQSLWLRFMPLAFLATLIFFIIQSLKEMVSFRPSVVVSAHASPIVGVVATVTAKLTFRPLLMGCPDWMSAYAAGLINKTMSSLGPAILQMVEFGLYNLSNHVFATTDFLKKLLISHGLNPEKITIIPNGVDTSKFTPEVDTTEIRRKHRLENSCVVLFTGHLEEWAGVNLLYDLAEKLNAEVPGALILLVGAGASVSDLFEKLVSKNLGHMLSHAGLHPYEEMPKYTAASDIALCIFPDTPVSHAASPLKLFEYLASGRAIVATNVAGTAEVIDDDVGILVPPGDIESICDAVVTLCRNKSLREKLGDQGRALVVEKYDWSILGDMFLQECSKINSD